MTWVRNHGLVIVSAALFAIFHWESEFLQMASYVALTIFLFQKGSSESKPID